MLVDELDKNSIVQKAFTLVRIDKSVNHSNSISKRLTAELGDRGAGNKSSLRPVIFQCFFFLLKTIVKLDFCARIYF